MTIDERLQAVLAPIATGGAHQDVAAQGVVAPYLVWQQVVSTVNNALTGASAMQNTRVQVDVYARTQAARRSLADAVVAAMAAASLTSLQISSQNLYEPETKLFRCLLEFSVWSA